MSSWLSFRAKSRTCISPGNTHLTSTIVQPRVPTPVILSEAEESPHLAVHTGAQRRMSSWLSFRAKSRNLHLSRDTRLTGTIIQPRVPIPVILSKAEESPHLAVHTGAQRRMSFARNRGPHQPPVHLHRHRRTRRIHRARSACTVASAVCARAVVAAPLITNANTRPHPASRPLTPESSLMLCTLPHSRQRVSRISAPDLPCMSPGYATRSRMVRKLALERDAHRGHKRRRGPAKQRLQIPRITR